MDIAALLSDKTIKAKGKVVILGRGLLDGACTLEEVLSFAAKAKDPEKGTCIEGIELATKQNPGMAREDTLVFMTKALAETAPRVKWESAKVIGHIAHLFPTKLSEAISNLLLNAEHEGTVVRWAAAGALGEILKLKTEHQAQLLPAVEAICAREEDNGVKKKYLDALKKARK